MHREAISSFFSPLTFFYSEFKNEFIVLGTKGILLKNVKNCLISLFDAESSLPYKVSGHFLTLK